MQIDVLTLAITTAITGAVGWAIKTMLDMLRGYIAESTAWRGRMDKKMDDLTDATQTTMRTTLLHYCEKYMTRGWVTPEERASLLDMHAKYAALNANGFIDSYMERIGKLPDREI